MVSLSYLDKIILLLSVLYSVTGDKSINTLGSCMAEEYNLNLNM